MSTTYTYILGVKHNDETGEKIGIFYDLPLGSFAGNNYSELSADAHKAMRTHLEEVLLSGNIPPEPTPREIAKSLDLTNEYTWCDLSTTVD